VRCKKAGELLHTATESPQPWSVMLASKKAGATKERSKDYFRSPRGTRGTFSLPNRTRYRWHPKEEAGERWTGETEKKVALGEEGAAPGEARRTNGPKRTSSRGFGNA
jgi:hypothetical protein